LIGSLLSHHPRLRERVLISKYSGQTLKEEAQTVLDLQCIWPANLQYAFRNLLWTWSQFGLDLSIATPLVTGVEIFVVMPYRVAPARTRGFRVLAAR
jgi:hypothetical protein